MQYDDTNRFVQMQKTLYNIVEFEDICVGFLKFLCNGGMSLFKHIIGMILGKEKGVEYYELMKQKNYIAVGQQYGKLVYRFSVNKWRRKSILVQMAKEGKLDVVAQIYSKRKLKKAKVLAAHYAEYQSGKPNKAVATGKYFFRRAIRSGITWAIVTFIFIIVFRTQIMSYFLKANLMSQKMDAEQQYAAAIEAFDSKAVEYGVYVFFDVFGADMENTTDLEVYNKIINDMWTNITGYGKPEIDAAGYMRLDIVSGNGVGVCRNMSDYMIGVLESQPMVKASDPRMFYVDMGHKGEYKLMSIERKFAPSNGSSQSTEMSPFLKKYAANHVIVAVDVHPIELEGKIFTLLIDPTNPGYGYLKDGEIVWINSAYDKEGNPNDLNPLEYTYKKLADYELNTSADHKLNTKAIKNSYKIDQETEDYIWANYDLSNQEEALEKIKQIDDAEYVCQTFFKGAVSDVLSNAE